MRLPAQDLDHVLENTSGIWGSLAGSRLFITGGTGFVGKWLVESLLWANDRLNLGVSLVMLTRDPDRFRAASPHLAGHEGVELLTDLRSAGEFPFVIHAGFDDTRHVLEFARARGCRRFLFTSSGAVYGTQPEEMSHVSEDYRGVPVTTYGRDKQVSESLCVDSGIDALIARLFAFVGPHLPLDLNFAAGNFIRDGLAGGPIRVNGDGTAQRSYLYAADLAIWLWTILLRGQPGRPYNVGSGDAVTIGELARAVAEACGGVPVEMGAGASRRYVPCVDRAQHELGLRPIIALDEGIRRTCKWLKSQYL